MNFKFKFLLFLTYFFDDKRLLAQAKKKSSVEDVVIQIDEGFRYVGLVAPATVPTPSVHVQRIDKSTVRTIINGRTNWFKIRDRVRWPGRLNIYPDGKVDIRFIKQRYREKDATNYTSVQKFDVYADKLAESFPAHWFIQVVDKDELNHDTCLLTVEYCNEMYNYIGVGRHFTVKEKVAGRIREYQYTPVPYFPITSLKEPNELPGDWRQLDHKLYMYVKSYSNGTLSKWLCERMPGQGILISNPQGTFCPATELKDKNRIFLIAAGTGITPMLSLMLYALKIIADVKVKLYFFNREEQDIVWRRELKAIEKLDPRFKVEYILSQPTSSWKGRKGRLTLEMVQEIFPKNRAPNVKSRNYFAVCGQPQFSSNAVQWLTRQMGYKPANVYAFLGQ